jgi:hypothetical protein
MAVRGRAARSVQVVVASRRAMLSVAILVVALLAFGWEPARHSVDRVVALVPHSKIQTPTERRTTPTSAALPTAHRIPRPRPMPARTPIPPSAQYVVLVVLDGAQPGLLKLPNLPHVHALVNSGVRYTQAWAGILESETPSGHAAIGTGSVPNANGILSFDWGNSDNIKVSLFDPTKIANHDMERLMAQAPAPTLAGLIHKRHRSWGVVALGGSKYYAVDAIGGPSANAIMYFAGLPDGKYGPTAVPGHVPPEGVFTRNLTYPSTHLPPGVEDHLAMQLAINSFRRMHQRVSLINMPEFDWPLGHVKGGLHDRADALRLMRVFDSDLGRLEDAYARAGVLKNTVFVLMADHGMSRVYHTVDYEAIRHAVAEAGTNVVDDAYHSAAYVWVKTESRSAQVALNIARLKNPYIQSVYFRSPTHGGWEYIRATGRALLLDPATENANQYLLKTFVGPNSPDVVVFFAEGAASLPGGEAQWKGDHGGNDWRAQHLPLVIAGPGVHRGVVSTFPARLEDVAPTLLQLLDVPHTGMQGIPLADALVASTSGERSVQAAMRRQLAPVVTALKEESRLELAAGR